MRIDAVPSVGSTITNSVQGIKTPVGTGAAAGTDQAAKVPVSGGVSGEILPSAQSEDDYEIRSEADRELIKKTIEDVNKMLKNTNTKAVFGIHEKTHRFTIKLIDDVTKEVIREYPSEKTLDMIAKVRELANMMVDEKG